jgi:hypothetical protein
MRSKLAVVFALALAAAACDTPVTPTPGNPPPPSPPTPQVERRVTGVVRDIQGQPIAGVLVRSWVGTAFSGDDGRYDVSIGSATVTSLTASKTGYESTDQYVSGGPKDLLLHEIVRISVGESIDVTVGPNDSIWETAFFEEYRSRIVRILSDTDTRVDLHVVDASGSPGQMVVPPGNCCVALSTVNFIRGIDYLVRIVVPWAGPAERTFTLRTSRAGE